MNDRIQQMIHGLLGPKAHDIDLNLVFEALGATEPKYAQVVEKLAKNYGDPENIAGTVSIILRSDPKYVSNWIDALVFPFTAEVDPKDYSASFRVGVLMGIFQGMSAFGEHWLDANYSGFRDRVVELIIERKGLLKFDQELDPKHRGWIKEAVSTYANSDRRGTRGIINAIAVERLHGRAQENVIGQAMLEAFVYLEFKLSSNYRRINLLAQSNLYIFRDARWKCQYAVLHVDQAAAAETLKIQCKVEAGPETVIQVFGPAALGSAFVVT